MNPGKCEMCGKDVEERCNDGNCRGCHKSLTFEECVNGEWVKKFRAERGMIEAPVLVDTRE